MYKVIRFYFKGGKRVLRRGLSLSEAQQHCSNPETSSSTAKGPLAVRRTAKYGPWFDGYDKE